MWRRGQLAHKSAGTQKDSHRQRVTRNKLLGLPAKKGLAVWGRQSSSLTVQNQTLVASECAAFTATHGFVAAPQVGPVDLSGYQGTEISLKPARIDLARGEHDPDELRMTRGASSYVRTAELSLERGRLSSAMAPEVTWTQAMCRLLFPLQFRFLSVACTNRHIANTLENIGAVYILIAIGI